MDLQLVKKGLNFSRRNKKWILLLALFGSSSYGAYKFYRSPYITRKRRSLVKLLGALFSVVEIVSDSAETIGVVSRDLKEFLLSDSDEIPNSLKQISKIAQSDEFSHSLMRVSAALTVGILRGYRSGAKDEAELGGEDVSFADRMMNRVLSNAGTGFVSVVVGSFARNLVLGFYANVDTVEGSNRNRRESLISDGGDASRLPAWMNAICSDKCKDLIADSIRVFVSTAVAVYLDKTLDINAYDEFFAGVTNPKHEANVRDMLVSVCNGAVETLVKTSHLVLLNKNSNSDCSSSSGTVNSNSNLNEEESLNQVNGAANLSERWIPGKIQNSQWVNTVSSTLAVPTNRRFMLHMTGRVTLETFRSLVEFLLWKLSSGLRRSVDGIHDQVIDRGLQVVRYFSAKSSIIVTICVALYLHIMCGTRVLLQA